MEQEFQIGSGRVVGTVHQDTMRKREALKDGHLRTGWLSSALSMKRDPAALQSREHDVLVIGGGIAGAWTVWEAASRGLSAALVECDDFGQATSWSSLKTAHGGLRHLQRLDLHGFRESLRERRALLRVAPEIVRPLGFAIPAATTTDRIRFSLAGAVNDALSLDRNTGLRADRHLGASRLISAAEMAVLSPAASGFGRAFLWHDAQIIATERLLLALLHAATHRGAAVFNHGRIETVTRGDAGFELRGRDEAAGTPITFRAKAVVNAAGSLLEDVARLFAETCGAPRLIRGVNIVLGRDLTPSVALGARDQGRFLFLSPWLGRSILGTAYDDGSRPVDALVGELLDAGRRAFPWAAIRNEDVRVVHSGYVPGVSGEPIYRSRIITHTNPRLLSVLTAKYTTARASAEAVVDRIGARIGRALEPSQTAVTELKQARPLGGVILSQIQTARDQEMALTLDEAVRGRLEMGARGLDEAERKVVDGAAGAFGRP